MSSPSKSTRPSPPSLTAASSSPVPHEEGGVLLTEDKEDVDQLAFTLDSPSRPQLEFFEKVFNTGKPLAGYSSDDPLWSLLSSLAVPCTNCLKVPRTCVVPPGSPRCPNCSSKKTCSLGKILHFRYFAQKCNQDLAYSRRFLELHGSPAQKASWTIPVDLWHRYDALLHERTSSTTALMELNMLDDSDALDRDHQELSQFLDTQRQETIAASKRKHALSPVRPGGATSSEAPAKTSHKHHQHLSPPTSLPSIVPRLVHLVLPPSQPPIASTTSLPLPSHAPVMAVDSLADAGIRRLPVPADHPGLVQGPTGLVCLAAVVEQRAGADRGPSSGIKGTSQDLLSSNMPPSHSRLIPHSHTTHPYRVENKGLSSHVRDLEAQLAESQLENSALTLALRDTSHSLEAWQWEVEQLWTSQREVTQQCHALTTTRPTPAPAHTFSHS
ncbi:hypothetical protein F5876DRAFT_70320 [Lentinula aff. lateritia]|uniref:Uncharacterized protein n=1 Tax=Lentinula aff. lateritia TaxID=2804960 RepID=A0ACC1TJE1_9AGAR|nr:hypothetical protein F5876DRAFT_70320 [Lentinula aff. lateritia]